MQSLSLSKSARTTQLNPQRFRASPWEQEQQKSHTSATTQGKATGRNNPVAQPKQIGEQLQPLLRTQEMQTSSLMSRSRSAILPEIAQLTDECVEATVDESRGISTRFAVKKLFMTYLPWSLCLGLCAIALFIFFGGENLIGCKPLKCDQKNSDCIIKFDTPLDTVDFFRSKRYYAERIEQIERKLEHLIELHSIQLLEQPELCIKQDRQNKYYLNKNNFACKDTRILSFVPCQNLTDIDKLAFRVGSSAHKTVGIRLKTEFQTILIEINVTGAREYVIGLFDQGYERESGSIQEVSIDFGTACVSFVGFYS